MTRGSASRSTRPLPGNRLSSCARLATVRDADIQHNAERYLDLFAPMLPVIGGGAPWAQCREAVWYWARQFIENTITRIMWWPDVDHLDDEPDGVGGATGHHRAGVGSGSSRSAESGRTLADRRLARTRPRDARQPDPGVAEPSRP